MSQEVINQAKTKMENALDAFHREMSKMRTGRASLSILDEIRVDYYGQMTPLNQVATMGVPEPQLITVTPWEQQMLGPIEKAIEKANLGLSPMNDGKMVRLPIPPLTEERRREIVKLIKGHTEESRVAIRHARRDAIDEFKQLEKDGEITEDDSKKLAEQTQKLTDDYIKKIEEAFQNKEQEVMQV